LPTVLIAPLSIGVISAILAAVITIIDKIVNNYGDVVIDINEGSKKLNVRGGAPLLTTLAESGIFVPSACGGRGSCGACKVKVRSDIGPLLPTETPYLTQEEIEDGVRLSCQIKVKADIDLSIPEELFNIQQIKGMVESIKDVTHDIKEVYIGLTEPEEISFKAGQYAQLAVPPYQKIRDYNQRAYSMSSPPYDKSHLEFLIRLVPGGIATTYVHTILKEGDEVELVGPFGDFGIRETPAVMLCIAGGSGMAPFRSIFREMVKQGKTDREVWYFFGARTEKDLFYLDEMKELEAEWKSFHFVPALSEPDPNGSWQGETGLITEVLDKYLTEKIDSEADQEGYLCGSPGMLDACIKVLTDSGIPEEKIYFDKFA
jgi:Na+-transporting NADH:ubiquinone oxidoreductase subunit F